jgi:hypothetical protein
MGSAASTDATQVWNDNRVRMNHKSPVRFTQATHNCANQNIGAGNSVVIAAIPASSMVLGTTLTVDTVEDSAAVVNVGVAEDGVTLVAASNAQVAQSFPGNEAPVWIASATNVHLSSDNACDTLVATVRIAYLDMSQTSVEDKA